MNNSAETASKLLAKWNEVQTAKNAAAGSGAFVVGLSGHLGAGKTSFTKLLAQELGITEIVTSPTFVIMKIYDIQAGAKIGGVSGTDVSFKRLVHIDAYRLERRAELDGLDFERISSDPHNLVIIEWPENAGLGREDVNEWLKLEIVDGVYSIDPSRYLEQ
ncbi:MAG TPA: tRNA (adenosine(37)-N6)-threonylcarbamoyltransferase complex ATPase subunit type 1 TsaE [Candidatus Paceibacterota bacterium]